MDPLTAIGLASNILSFIDFSVSLFKSAKEVHDSTNGTLDDNRSRETVVREMEQLSSQLLTCQAANHSGGNEALENLARECHYTSVQLISLLQKIKPKDAGSKCDSILSALRNKLYDKDREDLEARLAQYRSQLELQLSFLSRLVVALTWPCSDQALLMLMLMLVQKRDAGKAGNPSRCIKE